ncbi:MAG: DUF523 domain-containing protein [Candidatus Howiella sp.]|jgi:uncharacterized protein YbbK (DUF523 family)
MNSMLISACLLGVRCRYDGQSRPLSDADIRRLREEYILIPVCPEVYGGLPTPRPPAERQGERVVTQSGADVTAAYLRGAEETLRLAAVFGCRTALLKARSPSCGKGEIYDGGFCGRLVSGDGVLAERLTAAGVEIFRETEIDRLLSE